ncbi:hypothetical protein KCP71_00220 [Salmonella enterica subsp. enterica]|nr:hypothetical protein KCP71_00220 [Salmonella enterica subsp. enterica]
MRRKTPALRIPEPDARRVDAHSVILRQAVSGSHGWKICLGTDRADDDLLRLAGKSPSQLAVMDACT